MLCRNTLRFVLLVAGISTLSSISFAQGNRDLYRQCYEGDVAERVIIACSIVIADNRGDKHDLATAFKNRANAYDDKHKHELALNDYTGAIALNPQDADIFNSRGTTWIALGQYARAVDDFGRALELKPGFEIAMANACFAKAVLGQLDRALFDCNEALRIRPKSRDALSSRAFVHLKMKQAEQAINDYDAALALRSDDPYSLFGRAAAKRMKGDLRGSDYDVVRAQSIKPDIAEHMAKLGIELR